MERGIHWLTKAAKNGKDYAAYQLAKEYLTGKNISKDVKQAEWWFTQAAQSGNVFAQYALGKAYLFGKDLSRDQDRAVYWLEQASGQVNTYAESLLERVHDILGISQAGAYELVRSEGFPAFKVGSRILIPKEKFKEWLDKQAEKSLG